MPRRGVREEGQEGAEGQARSILKGSVRIKADDPRFVSLLARAISRPPPSVPSILTVRNIILSRRSTTSLVGLTRYCSVACAGDPRKARQSITFYSGLMEQLSSEAALGVLAHELAHAWLNEHVCPDDSRAREKEADETARGWGFGPELEALNKEAETI